MIRILKYGDVPNSELFIRKDVLSDVSGTVAEILDRVKNEGDRALKDYTLKFDKVELDSLEVSPEELKDRIKEVEPEFIEVLKRSAANIGDFHKSQLRNGFMLNKEGGIVVGQRITPIEKVGVYVPDGTAPLSSTVLMDVIPAKIAGCREIIMVSSPNADGYINPYI